jgi:alkylation response protein AidB-like acyl-CoA dehydrogenase
MDFMLSAKEKEYKEFCRRFAREKLIPLSEKYGETDDIPSEMVQAMGEAGLFKLILPQELGGTGVKALPICLAREEMAGIYGPADVTLAMQGLGSYPIYLAGNKEQKEKYLPRIGAGTLLTTFALTEPEAGSDVRSLITEAIETSNGFLVNGLKRFISNGHAAHMAVLFAKTPMADNPKAISAFVVEKGMPGFTVHRRLKLMAPHDITELKFENCLIPKENLLGEIGQGFAIAMGTLEVFRMTVGAAAVGIGQAALEATISYAKKRVQFNSPISKFQSVQFKVAEMATELDAARALVYRAAILKDQGGANVTRQAAMAKWYATEVAFQITDQGIQIHGGVGVMHGSTVERLFREIRALRIYEGTTEIQKMIIANSLLRG